MPGNHRCPMVRVSGNLRTYCSVTEICWSTYVFIVKASKSIIVTNMCCDCWRAPSNHPNTNL